MAFYWDIPSHEKNPDPEVKNPEAKKSRILGIQIPRLKKIRNPGDFGIFRSCPKSKIPIPNPRNRGRHPEKSHPEAKSGIVHRKLEICLII